MSAPGRKYDLIVYGAYGYTGKLITQVCKDKGLNVLISGRSESELKRLSESTGFDFQTVDLSNHKALVELLSQASVVIHSAGPFSITSQPMAAACLEARTHYLDITGEHEVMSALHQLNSQAQTAGIMIMPGVGFDVVPTDCMAAHLKARLPEAENLELAFAMVPTGVSRGTAKTALQSFGKPSFARKDGKLTSDFSQPKTRLIDFGEKKLNAVCISWGDIFSAWVTTGIPNIEVYMAASPSMVRGIKLALLWKFIFNLGIVRKFLSGGINKRPAGPGDEVLKNGKSLVYGKASSRDGRVVESRLVTSNGYRLTADMAVLIAMKVLEGKFKPGFSTPAACFGADLIMELPGSVRTDI